LALLCGFVSLLLRSAELRINLVLLLVAPRPVLALEERVLTTLLQRLGLKLVAALAYADLLIFEPPLLLTLADLLRARLGVEKGVTRPGQRALLALLLVSYKQSCHITQSRRSREPHLGRGRRNSAQPAALTPCLAHRPRLDRQQ